jgi:hypothetical protein
MRSHLTRNVFRRLLSNEPLLFRCPTRPIYHTDRRQNVIRLSRNVQRRTLFGFSRKPPRQVKDSDLDPGLDKMLNLFLMDKVHARPPPAEELIAAFRLFFTTKYRKKEAVNNIQAQHALRTFKHLQETNKAEPGFGLSMDDLNLARNVLVVIPKDKTDTHNEFARVLFAEIVSRKQTQSSMQEIPHADLVKFVRVLTATGDSIEARRLAQEFWDAGVDVQQANRRKTGLQLWTLVLKGFALEDNEIELLNTFRILEISDVPFEQNLHQAITTFYAKKDDILATKAWYSRPINRDAKPTVTTVSEVLDFCLRNNELEWCKEIFRPLLESNPTKHMWDVVFRWAAGGLGKGVEEVERMMTVMVRRNPGDDSMRPDSTTINGLIELAMSKNDSYLAERYIALGLKWGIQPNARTFLLQMDYRIDAGDLSGAQVAYESLQSEEILDEEDLPVINKYIRELCSATNVNYDRIISVTADLEERNARLEADTVSALCLMHLQRDELHEVVDILQAHTFHHTLDERARTRDAFLGFCLDRRNDVTRVWDAYTIFRQVFDETDITIRTQMMNEFFARSRSDMACHAFGHMRQHIRQEKRPTVSTYIQCFEGIARCADMENLDMVHNMMKMDSSIEPTTKLYNALMLAYTACDEPYRALDFWKDITNSVEGPTYASLQLVFRACEIKPFGDKPAKEIWNKMRKMEIDVTREVYTAYVGALAGQGLVDEVSTLIEGMEKDVGYGPDFMT